MTNLLFMTNVSHYRKALSEAIEERKKLMAQKNDIEIRVSKLNQTIYTLSGLCGNRTEAHDRGMESMTGLIRNIMRSASEPKGSKDVRADLGGLGYEIPGTNPQASVHSILKRLQKQGDIAVIEDSTPTKWIWKIKK